MEWAKQRVVVTGGAGFLGSVVVEKLRERGLFDDSIHVDGVKVRMLGSPLRIECERASLSSDGQLLLEQMDHSLCGASGWQTLSISTTGLTVHRFTRALQELENRQLVFAVAPPLRAVVRRESASRMRLERLVLQLKNRREVERVKLAAMVGYATALTCRRKFILDYFGQPGTVPTCGGCDVCLPGS